MQEIVFKWQEIAWKRLTATPPGSHHAYLFHGRAGSGKRQLAQTFAAWHLCETADDGQRPCGACDACRWIAQGSHPDLRVVAPEADAEEEGTTEPARPRPARRPRQEITVDQIRGLGDFVSVSSHRGRWKAIVIAPADALNPQAANALLKSLEEPPPATVFILVASRLRRLPATVLSRCLRVPLAPPPRDAAVSWLAARGVADAAAVVADAGGSPLLAEELAAHPSPERPLLYRLLANPAGIDPARDGANFERCDLAAVVDWHQKWCCDLLYAVMGAPVRYNLAAAAAIAGVARASDPVALARHWREIAGFRRLANHPLNGRLFCEDLLARYRQAVIGR